MFRGASTIDEIRKRFDNDVERFSNLESGQSATVDAPLALELVAQAALAVNPRPQRVLDLGCGAGNFTLRLLQGCDSVREVTLCDLSRPMLERAEQRIRESHAVGVRTLQGDLREVPFDDQQYDVILAGAVLHHLRNDAEWEATFRRIYAASATGGSFWIFDLVTYSHPGIQQLMWNRWGAYLSALKGPAYRDEVFAYTLQEDSPRSLGEQMRWLSAAGFSEVEVLHANSCFAAFGGIC